MNKKLSQAAALLGSSTSEKKAKSSAENGKLGGRPRKDYKVVDHFNGWASEPMTLTQAEQYVETHKAPTSRSVERVEVEWTYVQNVGYIWR